MSQQIISQGDHLIFGNSPKNTNVVEILLLVKFHWIPFSAFRKEVENVSAYQRPGRPSCFSDRPAKHKHSRGHLYHASCQVSLISFQWFQRRGRKCCSQSEVERSSCFSDRPEKPDMVKDVVILLPVQFRWIPFSGFRGEVENDSAIQRPGRPFCFSDRHEKHKYGRGRWDLASWQDWALSTMRAYLK